MTQHRNHHWQGAHRDDVVAAVALGGGGEGGGVAAAARLGQAVGRERAQAGQLRQPLPPLLLRAVPACTR